MRGRGTEGERERGTGRGREGERERGREGEEEEDDEYARYDPRYGYESHQMNHRTTARVEVGKDMQEGGGKWGVDKSVGQGGEGKGKGTSGNKEKGGINGIHATYMTLSSDPMCTKHIYMSIYVDHASRICSNI